MKLGTALDIIRNRERLKRKSQREMEMRGLIETRNYRNKPTAIKKFVSISSYFSEDVMAALKTKSKEKYMRNAVNKAIRFYLDNDIEEEK